MNYYYSPSTTYENIKMFISAAAAVIIVGCCIYFMKAVCEKRQLESIEEINNRQLHLQKEYYEKIINQEEKTRALNHDIKNHLRSITVMCDSGRFEELGEYIHSLNDDYTKQNLIYTGNDIADYFINSLIEQVPDLEYTVIGRFPDEMDIADGDFCVLIANALDNARDALLKNEENRRLEITIKNYKRQIYLDISNTAVEKKGDLLQTDKEDKKNHGYGTKNMKHVIEKYDGEIEWKYDNNSKMFMLKMIF